MYINDLFNESNEMDTPEFQAALLAMKKRAAQEPPVDLKRLRQRMDAADRAEQAREKRKQERRAEVDENAWSDGSNSWSSDHVHLTKENSNNPMPIDSASAIPGRVREGAGVFNIGDQVLYKGQPAEVLAVDGTAATVYVPNWKAVPGMVDDTMEVDPASKFLNTMDPSVAEQQVAEAEKQKTPGVALSKAYRKDFDGKKRATDESSNDPVPVDSASAIPGRVREQQINELDLFDKQKTYFKMGNGQWIVANYRNLGSMSGPAYDQQFFRSLQWLDPSVSQALGLDSKLSNKGPNVRNLYDFTDADALEHGNVNLDLVKAVQDWVVKNPPAKAAPSQQVAENINYWHKLQAERNTRINSLITELKESIK